MHRAQHGQCAAVIHEREAQSAVFAGNLHSEHTELREPFEIVVRDPVVAFDGAPGHRAAVVGQPGHERVAAFDVVGGGLGPRVYQRQIEAAKVEALREAGLAPTGFAGGLGNGAGVGRRRVGADVLARPGGRRNFNA